jgi:hypothetical protein
MRGARGAICGLRWRRDTRPKRRGNWFEVFTDCRHCLGLIAEGLVMKTRWKILAVTALALAGVLGRPQLKADLWLSPPALAWS